MADACSAMGIPGPSPWRPLNEYGDLGPGLREERARSAPHRVFAPAASHDLRYELDQI